MLRSRRSVGLLLLSQVAILGLFVGALRITGTSAQKPSAKAPVYGRYEVFPSKPDGTSATIGELPAEKPGHRYISVSSAAFQPADSAYTFVNYGKGIINSDGTFQTYIAPIQLPPGSIVTNLVMVGGDTEPDTAGNRDGAMALSLLQSDLDRLDLAGTPPSEQDVAVVLSYPNTPLISDLGIYSATATLTSTVDPVKYAYLLKIDMPTSNMVFRSARVEYLPPGLVEAPILRKDQ